MSWLAELSTPSGARWSCGAYWADAASPSGTDTDWENSADWPKTYSAAAALALGVYVGGDDVTDQTQTAGWSLGNADPLSVSLSPSSCSLQLSDDATVTVGDRVCICTEADVLWYGTVEESAEVEDVERTTISVQATDDLVRAAPIEVEDVAFGGDTMAAADAMLRRAGIAGRAYSDDADTHTAPAEEYVARDTHSGNLLSLLADMLWYTCHLAAWAPAGLRVCPVWLEDVYDAPVESLDALEAITRSRTVQDVRNDWYYEAAGSISTSGEDVDSIDTYGLREISVVAGDWALPWASGDWFDYWLQVTTGATIAGTPVDYKDFSTPIERISASGPINSRRHTLARLVPFDTISDGAQATAANDRWRVLRVSHALSADSYSVSIEGIATGDPD